MLQINQLFVEITINEDTVEKELIHLNKDCHCVTLDWRKTMAV